jgi:hypothetical protein
VRTSVMIRILVDVDVDVNYRRRPDGQGFGAVDACSGG